MSKKKCPPFVIKASLDFVGLEPGWQSKSYPALYLGQGLVPRAGKICKRPAGQHIRVNLWTNPYVSPEAPFYQAIRPFTGSHTVWTGLVPDLTMQGARKPFFDQLQKDQVDVGVSGYKIDEVDGL